MSGEAASSHVSQHLARTTLPSTTRLRHRWRHGGARLSQGRECRPLGRWWPRRRPPNRLPRISSNQFLWPSAAGHSAYPAFRRVPETSRDARVLVSGSVREVADLLAATLDLQTLAALSSLRSFVGVPRRVRATRRSGGPAGARRDRAYGRPAAWCRSEWSCWRPRSRKTTYSSGPRGGGRRCRALLGAKRSVCCGPCAAPRGRNLPTRGADSRPGPSRAGVEPIRPSRCRQSSGQLSDGRNARAMTWIKRPEVPQAWGSPGRWADRGAAA